MDKVKDVIDTYAKILDAHIVATLVQLGMFPDSKYWQGQHDSLIKLRDALRDLEIKKNG